MAKKQKRGLTEAQNKFAIEYVKTGKPAQSYRNAGYKCDVMSSNAINVKANAVLNNPNVQAKIKKLRNKADVRDIENIEALLDRLVRMLDANLFDYIEPRFDETKDDVPKLFLKPDITDEAKKYIKKIKATQFGFEIELHDHMDIIKTIMKIKGWDKIKVEIENGTMSFHEMLGTHKPSTTADD